MEGTSESVLPVRPNFIRTLAASTSLYGVMPGLSDQSYSVLEEEKAGVTMEKNNLSRESFILAVNIVFVLFNVSPKAKFYPSVNFT